MNLTSHTSLFKLSHIRLLTAALALGFLACLSVLCPPAYGAAGGSSAAFLDIPVGAGPAAVGSAYSAQATNAYAPVWNPAGLGRINSTEVAAQHVSYLESINYEFAGVVHPISPTRALGVSAQYMGTGDIPRTNSSGSNTGDFSSHFAAYSLAYGQRVGDRLSLGVTGKWIDAAIAGVNANAWAADVGGLYEAAENLMLAATVTNMGTPLQFLSEKESLPLAGRMGMAYRWRRRWTFSADGAIRKSGPDGGFFGIEWKPMELMALRTGYRTDTTKELGALAGFSAGLGLTFWGQEFAYAWLPYGDLGDAQYVSMVLRFGAKPDGKRNFVHFQDIHRHRVAQTPSPVETSGQTYTREEILELLKLYEESPGRLAEQGGSAR